MTSSDSSEDEDYTHNTVIIDNGSCTIKANYGYEGSDNNLSEIPRSIPCVVGYPRHANTHGINKSFYIGEEAVTKRGVLNLKHPIQRGSITDWDNMEKVGGSFEVSSVESQGQQ